MIYTSYFANVKAIAAARPDMAFISIAGGSPDWFDGSSIRLMRCGKLAPRWAWWSEWKSKFGENPDSEESMKWYADKYSETILSKLSPKETANELTDMSDGRDVCLLCWETPRKFCHRQLVSKWLNSAGVKCSEIDLKAPAE